MSQQTLITGIEIGTSKITVLMGVADINGRMHVIGMGERVFPAEEGNIHGAVCKGEITNMDKVYPLIEEAVDEAESTSGYSVDRDNLFLSITGGHIRSIQSHGTSHICSHDRVITDEIVDNTVEGATNISLAPSLQIVNMVDSFYLLDDDARRVGNPVGMTASKLEAVVHVILGEHNRIQTSQAALHQLGYDQDVHSVFAPLANTYGVLSEQEKFDGIIVIDMGAGTTEYAVIINNNIQASGVLPIGVNHIANDLHIALNIPFQNAMQIVKNDALFSTKNAIQSSLSCESVHKGTLVFPLHSVELVIEQRLNELFGIIHERIKTDMKVQIIRLPIAFSGGGANSKYIGNFLSKSFGVPLRVASPSTLGSYAHIINTPAYATSFGLLEYGEFYRRSTGGQDTGVKSSVTKILDNKMTLLLNQLSKIFK